MAFITACISPTISVILFFPQTIVTQKHKFTHTLFFVLKIFITSIIAALFITSFLSHPMYLMGIERFIGVKTSFLLPILLIGLYFYLNPQRLHAAHYVFSRMIKSPLHTSSLLIISLFVFIITILILRSGNYVNLPLPQIEQQFREFLETTFFARPRYKEFLIGYPLLMITYYFVDKHISRHILWFFIVLGAIGPISVINSFCHIHTPLAITFYRSVLGLVLGCFIGSILILMLSIWLGKKTHGKINH